MESFTTFFNTLSALGGIVFLALSVILLFSIVTKRNTVVSIFVATHTLVVVCSTALLATIGSLIYSLVIGFPPCDLCWYQRIFMYPIAFISLLDLWTKRATSMLYSKLLAIGGLLFASFHTLIYYTNINPIPCSATASCTARYVWEFGFMTIPLMALSSFVFILLALLTKQHNPQTTLA